MTAALTWRPDDLRRLWPHAPQTLIDGINATKDEILPKYGITTRNRITQFMGMNSEETGGGTRLEEDLRYSGARMWQLWGHARFGNLADAMHAAAGGVQAIAEAIYGHRADLGNTQPGDGYRFRGQGLIQLTGRANFAAIGKITGLDLINHPELARDPEHCLEVAAGYWSYAKVNPLADTGSVAAVTKRVNGGLINLQARVTWVAAWNHVDLVPIGGAAPAAPDMGIPSAHDLMFDPTTLQRALNTLGAKLTVDNSIGRQTKAAIQAFQEQHKLITDGVVGQATAEAIISALQGPRAIGGV